MDDYHATHPAYTELALTERLRLVAPDLRFATASLAWLRDPQVVRFMGDDFSSPSLAGEEARLIAILQETDAYHWIIEYDGRAVGNINLSDIAAASAAWGGRAAKLTYLLGDRALWGQGLTHRAAQAVLAWAFTRGDFALLGARVLPQNARSQSLIGRLGFTPHGTEPYDGPPLEQPTHWVTYRLMKEAWSQQHREDTASP